MAAVPGQATPPKKKAKPSTRSPTTTRGRRSRSLSGPVGAPGNGRRTRRNRCAASPRRRSRSDSCFRVAVVVLGASTQSSILEACQTVAERGWGGRSEGRSCEPVAADRCETGCWRRLAAMKEVATAAAGAAASPRTCLRVERLGYPAAVAVLRRRRLAQPRLALSRPSLRTWRRGEHQNFPPAAVPRRHLARAISALSLKKEEEWRTYPVASTVRQKEGG